MLRGYLGHILIVEELYRLLKNPVPYPEIK
jgi:hypothetical protein